MFEESNLWKRLEGNSYLCTLVQQIRKTAELIAAEIPRVGIDFTDHSITHMDGLWKVLDAVLTSTEVSALSESEAFLLAASFYTHDLGMAYAASSEGLDKIKNTKEFRSALETAQKSGIGAEAERLAIQDATRILHAGNSSKLITDPLPNLNRYLFEITEDRNRWGASLAEISESHNWPLSILSERIGKKGKVADPLGGECDLGYVACLLRITDYAHINSDRASVVTKMLRMNLPSSSLVHWQAQEFIAGPIRKDNQLYFNSTKPIGDVTSWWLMYEMTSGLNTEILQVSEYLRSRSDSNGRFSLEGVHNIATPQLFALMVEPGGFDPVDIRFRPDSMERLVEILGGKQLYANDKFAPIRELLQNAYDAILVKKSRKSQDATDFKGLITIAVKNNGGSVTLSVTDNGIGMNQEVISNYLLGIASNFWNSSYFLMHYKDELESGFQPVGKFGIGFLSVFMVGDNVEVFTQKFGSRQLRLQLDGIGKRGALTSTPAKEATGTTVCVTVNRMDPGQLLEIEKIVRARAPMMPFPVKIESSSGTMTLEPFWWKSLPQDELLDYVQNWHRDGLGSSKEFDPYLRLRFRDRERSLNELDITNRWSGTQPESVSDNHRVMAIPGSDTILVCRRGIAIQVVHVPGFCGIYNLEEVEVDASRSHILGFNFDTFKKEIISKIEIELLRALDELSTAEYLQRRFELLVKVGRYYGIHLLKQTILRWIPIIQPSGEQVFISAKEAIATFLDAESIILGFGISPWSMPEIAHRIFSNISKSTMLICLPDIGQGNFGNYRDDEYVTGTLEEQLKSSNGTPQDLEGFVFLNTVLELVSEATKIPLDTLIDSEWYRMGHKYLIVRFKT